MRKFDGDFNETQQEFERKQFKAALLHPSRTRELPALPSEFATFKDVARKKTVKLQAVSEKLTEFRKAETFDRAVPLCNRYRPLAKVHSFRRLPPRSFSRADSAETRQRMVEQLLSKASQHIRAIKASSRALNRRFPLKAAPQIVLSLPPPVDSPNACRVHPLPLPLSPVASGPPLLYQQRSRQAASNDPSPAHRKLPLTFSSARLPQRAAVDPEAGFLKLKSSLSNTPQSKPGQWHTSSFSQAVKPFCSSPYASKKKPTQRTSLLLK